MNPNTSNEAKTFTAQDPHQLGSFTSSPDARLEGVIDAVLAEPLVQEALRRLEQELPADLQYHSFEHTASVLQETLRFALRDGLGENDIKLLAIAAAWHDTGFIVQRTQNEPIAAQWAREAMTKAGHPENEIADVERAILDTQIKMDTAHRTLIQVSNGRLSPWLLDADLANFGRAKFFEKTLQVYGEMVGREIRSPLDMRDDAGCSYIATTIRFVANHRWHTVAAREELSAQEQVNLRNLGILLGQLTGGTDASITRAWEQMLPSTER